MKYCVFFVLLTILIPLKSYSQSYVIMGIRDNSYAQIDYSYRSKYYIKAEQSLFIAKAKNQTLCLYLGYLGKYRNINYNCSIYKGIHYNNYFGTMGGFIDIKTKFWDILDFYLGLRPHYDSAYKYKTCYKIGLGLNFHKEITFVTIYQNYPEYRLCEDRINTGLKFKVNNLVVFPNISIPIHNKKEDIRLLLSFGYKLLI